MKDPFTPNELKVAVIGGGTGSFTILSALKEHTSQIAAIVNMADDGGSTGVLRDELGTLPPGDVRQCMVALSDSKRLRDLFNYRFEEGSFSGHALGNILLSALEKSTGSFAEAVETASDILRINGTVIPATLDNVRLKMEWPAASYILNGERVIDADYFKHDPRKAGLSLLPKPTVNPMAVQAIEQADVVLIAPGDLYTSLGPLLVIDGIGDALRRTDAMVVYVCNLVTKDGQTNEFTVTDHAAEIERFGGGSFIDYVIYNNQQPDIQLAARYKKEKAFIVKADKEKLSKAHYESVGGSFLGHIVEHEVGDNIPATRSLIRHNADAITDTVIELYDTWIKREPSR